ncbi:MAG TPA: hypothetical protein VLZ81_02015, partial [Blastocatellia bacterium]|nr:hypothetical protein [Blastocatellia bacterium]
MKKAVKKTTIPTNPIAPAAASPPALREGSEGVKKSAAPLRCGVTCQVASAPVPTKLGTTVTPKSSLPAALPPALREGSEGV